MLGVSPALVLPRVVKVRHLPVVDRKQRLVGIITRKDTLPELIDLRRGSGDTSSAF